MNDEARANGSFPRHEMTPTGIWRLNQIEAEERAYRAGTLSPMPWKDIRDKEFSKQRWRIEDLIPLEGFVILAGISGEKKSWVALEMARCISSGADFLGKFRTIEGNVLYIDEEMPTMELQRRGKQLGLEGDKGKLLFLSLAGLRLNGDDEAEDLLKCIQHNDIQTIFVDTLRAVAGGMEENKAEAVRAFFDRFKVLKNSGVTIIFLDHFRKPSHFEGKIPKKEHLFASQDKTASVEVLLMVQSDDGSDIISVYQRKNRLGREIEPFNILMKDEIDEDFITQRTTMSYSKHEDFDSKKEEAREAILELLKDNGMTRKDVLRIIFKERKIGEKNISDALREMVVDQTLGMQKQGRENFYVLAEIYEKEAKNKELFLESSNN